MAKSEVKKTTKQIVKVKKKKWVPIIAPKFMGESVIGESFIDDETDLSGRTVKVNLMQLSGDVKNQSSEVRFEILGLKDNKIETKVIGYSFSASTIKRFMRRHMTRIDDSIVVMTQDNVKIRIKPFLLTRSKVSRAVEYSLRVNLREELINFVKKTPYEQLFSMVAKYQMQKEIKEKLNKIYPLKNLEIRILEEEKHHAAKETEMPVKKISKKMMTKKEKTEEELEEDHKKEDVKEETPSEKQTVLEKTE